MQYDVASKVILEHCRNSLLRDLCGLPVKDAELTEIHPQETASLRRSDFVLKALFDDLEYRLVLLEFITAWKKYLPLRTLESRCRHILREKMDIITIMIALRKCPGIRNCYNDNEVCFQYKLINLHEIKAEKIIKKGQKCLYPFVPLMQGGQQLIDKAEKEIYEGEESREYKADLLTGMAILGGLISRDIPLKLIQKRRDIMIQSAAYDIIKQEGYEEGKEYGFQQGKEYGFQEGKEYGFQQGVQQGVQQGIILEAQDMLLEAIEERFEIVPQSITQKIQQINSKKILESLFRIALRVHSLEEFDAKLKMALN